MIFISRNSSTIIYNSPLGAMYLHASDEGLMETSFLPQTCSRASEIASSSKAAMWIEKAISELEDYFSGRSINFSVPLAPSGTLFQKQVWNGIAQIEYGKTIAYSELALLCGNVNSTRAVASACGKNPIAIFIPCHRVIGRNGSLHGFKWSLPLKKKLLCLEGSLSSTTAVLV